MQIIRYIAPLVALLAVACTSSVDDAGAVEQELGSVAISMEVTSSSAEQQSESELLKSGTLRIYNSTGGLVRYYKDLTAIGVSDFLAVGSYSAKFAVGTETPATYDSADISYSGEKEFEIVSQQTSTVGMDVYMDNTMVTITFDETLDINYTDYSLVVYAADDINDVDAETTPTLTYTQSGDGYLIIPDDVENIVWEFIDEGSRIATGSIFGAERAHQYQLLFKYSDCLEVSGLTITIGGTVDYDDIFGFKPQPVIKGSGFNIDETQNYVGSGFELSITSISEISNVSVSVGENSYTAGVDSQVSYSSDTKKLTLSSEIFEAITQAGVHSVAIAVTNVGGVESVEYLKVGIDGYIGLSDGDFWASSATLKWYTVESHSSVEMKYRTKDSSSDESGWSEWTPEISATTTDGYEWSVESQTQWETTDAFEEDGSMVTKSQALLLGYAPSKDYEYQFIMDDVEQSVQTHSTSATTQSITSLSNSGLSCYGSSNTSATFWASGNNSYADDLCTYDTSTSSAYLKAQTAVIAFAAGNVFSGTFSQSGTSGTVGFGQVYSWQARPKSISVNYKSTVGSGDQGLIYFAVVDWSSRHSVVSTSTYTGSLSSVTGVWNPSTQSYTDEGKIIGYALTYLTASQSSFATLELPIYYYDTDAVPTSGNYSIVIMSTTSYKGEYFEGSTSSRLYVKDFEFGY